MKINVVLLMLSSSGPLIRVALVNLRWNGPSNVTK